jgi:hypothetical protein
MPVNKNGRRAPVSSVRNERKNFSVRRTRPPGNPFKFGLRNSLKEKIGA